MSTTLEMYTYTKQGGGRYMVHTSEGLLGAVQKVGDRWFAGELSSRRRRTVVREMDRIETKARRRVRDEA